MELKYLAQLPTQQEIDELTQLPWTKNLSTLQIIQHLMLYKENVQVIMTRNEVSVLLNALEEYQPSSEPWECGSLADMISKVSSFLEKDHG